MYVLCAENEAMFTLLLGTKQFYSCMQQENIADIHFYSLWQAPIPQRRKKPILLFDQMLISQFSLEQISVHIL